jgi:hypothetical protein
MKKLSEIIGRLVVDLEAETLTEISERTLVEKNAVGRLRDEGLKSGRWEQVWKKQGTRMVKAYRSKR